MQLNRFIQVRPAATMMVLSLAGCVLCAGCKSAQKAPSEFSEIINLGNTFLAEGDTPLGILAWAGLLTSVVGLIALALTKGTKGGLVLLIGLGLLILNLAMARSDDWLLIPILLVIAGIASLYTYGIVRRRQRAAAPTPQESGEALPEAAGVGSSEDTKVQFARQVPKWLVAMVGVMLTCSLVLNVIALLPNVAFIEMFGVMMSGPYSILDVVGMLWEAGLYPLAFLVIGFSVIFPPVKIGLASWAFLRPMTAPGRQRLLGTLGQLGRWSLLDVFVALLLLIITSKQTFTGTTVSIGLYAFLGAIVLSMSSVALMQEFNRPLHRSAPRPPEPAPTWQRPMLLRAGLRAWIMLPLLFIAIMCLEMAVNLPLFQIDRFGLMSNTWSLWGAVAELQAEGLGFFAGFMLFFLLIAPAILVIIAILVLLLPIGQKPQRCLYVAMHHVYEWCMLDVFALAMLLYLSEERNFAHLDLKAGIWYLFGAMVVFHLVMYATVYLVRRETGLSKRPVPRGAAG
jgi:paraquat-inducible protein A